MNVGPSFLYLFQVTFIWMDLYLNLCVAFLSECVSVWLGVGGDTTNGFASWPFPTPFSGHKQCRKILSGTGNKYKYKYKYNCTLWEETIHEHDKETYVMEPTTQTQQMGTLPKKIAS